MGGSFKSKALEANLEQTKVKTIVIPEEQQWFLELSKEKWGIHKRTDAFLRELNHAMRNTSDVLDMLHTICLSDLWFYNGLEDAERALIVVVDLFTELAAEEGYRDKWLMCLVKFIDRLVKLETFPISVIDRSLGLLEHYWTLYPALYIKNSRYFKTYLAKAAYVEGFESRVIQLTKSVLSACVDAWAEHLDLMTWYKEKREVLNVITEAQLEDGSVHFYRRLKAAIEASSSWRDVEELMSYNDIANYFRSFTEAFESPLETIYYLSLLLHTGYMAHLSNHLLYDINRNMRHVFKEISESDTQAFIDAMMQEFTALEERNPSTVLDCMLTLGKEIIHTGNENNLRYFVFKLIESGFHQPGAPTLNENWQIEVNPNHIKNIRTWLELIGYNPSVSRNLVAALIVNLKLGGVFIADTDLFQRDVTQLLNSDIVPVYREIKQLAKLFPVYFRDIGAEGELRDVSTAVDELSMRQDRLIHFLRKQIHTESNNTHIALTEAVLTFWYSGDHAVLEDKIPADVAQWLASDTQWSSASRQCVQALVTEMGTPFAELFYQSQTDIEACLARVDAEAVIKKRVLLLFKVHDLLREKYAMASEHVVNLLRGNPLFTEGEIKTFVDAVASENYRAALDKLFEWMQRLKAIVVDSEKTEGFENIYYKRHLAVGIPSMYGQYVEPKFEALGMIYRLEVYASKMMRAWVEAQNLDFVTGKTLDRVYDVLTYFKEGLALDGINNEGFNSRMSMLKFSLTSKSFSLDQFMNIFEFISRDIKQIIQEYFIDVYERPLKLILPQMGYDTDTEKQKVTEGFLRDHLYTAFFIQDLDQYVSKILSTLHEMAALYSRACLQNMMTYSADQTITSLTEVNTAVDNTVFIGAKAFFLKRLKAMQLNVPEGFVLTTEVFRHRRCIWEHPHIRNELKARIAVEMQKLEAATGKRYGDTENPLLLSVRSGSSISLPGAMMTFLNVGMNDAIAEKFGEKTQNKWMAYDCYRRLLQSYGMAFGMHRDVFDQMMEAFKARFNVRYKSDFTGAQMAEIAGAYKSALKTHGVYFESDPVAQLEIIIKSVIESWFSESAKTYRKYMEIAEEWGTAVLVQKMVLGNQNASSGTGVVFTNNPMDDLSDIELFGDYVLQSQGEDVVSGLVNTRPVSKSQGRASGSSMEEAFPALYAKLKQYAQKLIHEEGYVHQEIEFTFTSDAGDDLYILQTRNQKIKSKHVGKRFGVADDKLTKLGKGIGAGNGLINGFVAFDATDIQAIKSKTPEANVILFRTATVPDDIPLIFESEGLITTKGGITSHAAVTAAGLGKSCIVETKGLQIDEVTKTVSAANHVLRTGDAVAMDGHLGNVYMGHHSIETVAT